MTAEILDESGGHQEGRERGTPSNARRIPLRWLREKSDRSFPSRRGGNDADADEVPLPSFADLQRKTFRTLYGGTAADGSEVVGVDKSPKGCVDAPIRPLVDLINRHSSFCTLSSCSGRLSLFDPNGRHEGVQGSNPDAEDHDANTGSGKGRGGWLLISHDPIFPSDLLDCFPGGGGGDDDDDATEQDGGETCDGGSDAATGRIPWVFKLEPMLLHIAARSLKRGKQLLQLALELGFRESGLVVSAARVTVAIRGHSLALSVPLAPKGPLRASALYLRALAKQANRRLKSNWRQLNRLYDRIEATLFEIGVTPRIKATRIARLNLWSAATVQVAMPVASATKVARAIYAFGGYGIGPGGNEHSARRSSAIYRLECPKESQWEKADWQPVHIRNPPGGSKLGQLEVSWKPKLPDCQGMGAAKFSASNLVLVWGGRAGPKKPIGDIFLFDPSTTSLATPADVRGTPPTPRWGHCMVAFDDRSIFVSGGRNLEETAMDDVYILHFCDDHLSWERLDVTLPTPLFHHMSVVDGNTVCTFGGLQTTSNLLEPFRTHRISANHDAPLFAIRIEKSEFDVTNGNVTSTVEIIRNVHVAATDTAIGAGDCTNGLKRFGAAASSSDELMLVCGGLQSQGGGDVPPIESYFLAAEWDRISLTNVPLQYCDQERLDFGSMVHHTTVSVGTNEFLIMGGGVASFAFGNSFPSSYHVRIELPSSNPQSTVPKKSVRSIGVSQSTDTAKEKSSVTHILTVAPKDAKLVKNKLQAMGWLDKRYRMTKQSPQTIAVPVEPSVLEAIREILENPSESWHSLLLRLGEGDMPFSTSQFARKGKSIKDAYRY